MKKLGLVFAMVVALVLTVSCVNKEVPVTETYYETEYRTETYSEIEDVVVGNQCGEDSLSPQLKWYAPNLTMSFCKKVWYFGYSIPRHDTSHIQVILRNDLRFEFQGGVYAYDLGELGHIPQPPSGQWVLKQTPTPNPFGGEPPPWQTGEFYYVWGDPPGQHALKDWMASANSKIESARYPGKWTGQGTFEFDAKDTKNLAIFACGATFEWEPIREVKLKWCDNTTEARTVIKEHEVPYQVEKQRTVMQTKKVPFWETIFH